MLKIDPRLKKLNELKEELSKTYIYKTKNIGRYHCCPFCGCMHFIKYGKYNGIQRYLCKECNKTFSNTTNSVWKFSKKDPENWIKFIELTLEGKTLAACAQILSMSLSTAFYWRHKLFHAIEKTYKIKTLQNSAEIYIYMTDKCYKGSKNVHFNIQQQIARRLRMRYHLPHGVDVLMVKESKKICFVRRTEPNESNLENIKNNILNIADKHCYLKLEKTNRYDLKKCIRSFNSKIPKCIREKYESDFHINEQCRRFSAFLNAWKKKFRGIATKYINHYYNFFSLLYADEEFTCLSLFSEIMKNGLFMSVQSLKYSHIENY